MGMRSPSIAMAPGRVPESICNDLGNLKTDFRPVRQRYSVLKKWFELPLGDRVITRTKQLWRPFASDHLDQATFGVNGSRESIGHAFRRNPARYHRFYDVGRQPADFGIAQRRGWSPGSRIQSESQNRFSLNWKAILDDRLEFPLHDLTAGRFIGALVRGVYGKHLAHMAVRIHRDIKTGASCGRAVKHLRPDDVVALHGLALQFRLGQNHTVNPLFLGRGMGYCKKALVGMLALIELHDQGGLAVAGSTAINQTTSDTFSLEWFVICEVYGVPWQTHDLKQSVVASSTQLRGITHLPGLTGSTIFLGKRCAALPPRIQDRLWIQHSRNQGLQTRRKVVIRILLKNLVAVHDQRL